MAKLNLETNGRASFMCPGCVQSHTVRVSGENAWQWNGDVDAFTLQPSVLFQSGHFDPYRRQDKPCWCTYNAEHPDDPAPFKCVRCHSFITDGRIQFLGDSTHEKANQTVEIPDWENDEKTEDEKTQLM
jgi:hypothetical protein